MKISELFGGFYSETIYDVIINIERNIFLLMAVRSDGDILVANISKLDYNSRNFFLMKDKDGKSLSIESSEPLSEKMISDLFQRAGLNFSFRL